VDLTALWVTVKLATCSTTILLFLGLPVACFLARTTWRGKFLLEAVVALPLVLPPTVLGFYLLATLGPYGPFGSWTERLTGGTLPFTFPGIVLGSVLYNVPFAVRPFASALAHVDRRLIEASWCLGESRLRTFWRIELPLAWPGILTGIALTFAHAIGEFGVVLMLGGNRPGVTRTLSIALYDDVQALDYASAHQTALCLLIFAFIVLCATSLLERRAAS